ncbi:hypothetical protein RND81_10G071000 [Saponaria officinalis]|uniref:Uncharacterized protein n=1 Tax=Saponaria officinalis TaxID=3572 RepID=A0AAW1HZ48_SAPOF
MIGLFPSFLQNLSSLQSLSLGYNGLNGSVPLWLGNLSRLEYLDLTSNSLVKVDGGMWGIIGNPCIFKHLDLSVNTINQGNFLDHFVNSSRCDAYDFEYIDLQFNGKLQADLPSLLGHLTKLKYLDLSGDEFHGGLPMSFSGLSSLQHLNLSKNRLSGFIPDVFGDSTKEIEYLDISSNSLHGELPKWLWNMTNIQKLQLSGNQLTGNCQTSLSKLNNNMFSGKIPHWLCHLQVTVIDLSDNLLSGAIFEGENTSSLLTAANFMYVLNLSDNMLSGEIQIKDVAPDAYFQILSLRGNDFTGIISSQLCNYPQLVILELAHNHLTGHIPPCLGSVRLDSYYASNTFEDVDIHEINKRVSQKFNGGVGIHSTIDFLSNRLVGTIPEELTNISKLMQLNLSNNHFTGSIPGYIGKLQMLESLDLSNNNLSGTIPQSLSTIPWLSKLNVSNNHLHGPIPTGSQLQTLDDPSICTGNSGLCGFPLLDQCTKLILPHKPTNMDPVTGGEDNEDSEDKYEILWFYLVIMSGVSVGFWGVVGTLFFKKKWRHAYFRFVEDTADKILCAGQG